MGLFSYCYGEFKDLFHLRSKGRKLQSNSFVIQLSNLGESVPDSAVGCK